MKLESLKSSKFEAFKENELLNSFLIVGGLCTNTYANMSSPLPNDSLRTGTDGEYKYSVATTNGNVSCEKVGYICPVPPSEGQGLIIHPTPLMGQEGDVVFIGPLMNE